MIARDMPEVQDDELESTLRPSKSELKRQSAALRDLGTELLQLGREQLERMDLPNELSAALNLARSMKRDSAYKRQTKYIGKLLRNMDHAPIEAQLAEIAGESASASRALHRIEAWRDRLIAEGDTALGELMAAYPRAERPRVRRLIDSARLERERAQPPGSSRLLFKYLRELLEPDHPPRGGVG